MIRVIETGAPYHLAPPSRSETVHFNYDPEEGLCELTFFIPSPTERETVAIGRQPIRLGVAVLDGLTFITYQCPGLRSGDTPYSWHAALRACLSPETVPLPDIPNEGWSLMVVLVDATTGLVAAWRMTTMSLRVSRALARAIHDEAAHPVDEVDYLRRVGEVYGRLRPAQLRRHAVTDLDASTADPEQAEG